MKKSILILFCCFCKYIYCTERSEWLADEGSIEVLGSTTESAPTHGITGVRIKRGRVKREARNYWRMTVGRSNGSNLILNCVQTDGILVDRDTPVWRAERSNMSDEIIYTPISALKDLGEFDFCQDFDDQGAAVIFHDQQITDMYVGEYHLMFRNSYLPSSSGPKHQNSSVPESKSSDFDNSGIPKANRVKREEDQEALRSDPLPATVYPQLLIQLEPADVRRNLSVALMRMLSYWNAVDLLYSSLEQPQIELNIAGIIAPADNFSTPWITNSKYADHDKFINKSKAMSELGRHFNNYSHIFPDDEYDFMFSFVKEQLGEKSSSLGVSYVHAGCGSRSRRVSLIRNYLDVFLAGARQLARLLSVRHDDEKSQCEHSQGIMAPRLLKTEEKFEWSNCSQEFFRNHFKKMMSQCLDNCPRTRLDCDGQPDTEVSERTPNVTTELPNFSCVRHPAETCQNTPWPLFTGLIACDDNMMCTRDGVENDLCSKSPLSPAAAAICRYIEYPIPPEDGTICEWNESGPISACYFGRCVPIDRNTPRCAGFDPSIQFKFGSHST